MTTWVACAALVGLIMAGAWAWTRLLKWARKVDQEMGRSMRDGRE